MATKTTSGSKGIGRSRFLASFAMLFGAIFTILLLPAYGQQEVDPAWYDPWAAPSTAVAHPSQPPAVVHSSQPPVATDRYQQKATTVLLAPGAGRFRGRDTQLDQSRHNAAHKRVELRLLIAGCRVQLVLQVSRPDVPRHGMPPFFMAV